VESAIRIILALLALAASDCGSQTLSARVYNHQQRAAELQARGDRSAAARQLQLAQQATERLAGHQTHVASPLPALNGHGR
jgi:hypothetical protein